MMLLFFFLSCTEPPQNVSLAPLPELPKKQKQDTAPKGPQTEKREAIITLVGEVRGEIEPCGCPTLPYGGFARRGQFLQTLPSDLPLFQLDAGEMLLKGFSAEERAPSITRAQLLLDLSKEVGVDVMTVGPTDISTIGIERLQQYNGFPIISASYQNKEGTLLFPPITILEKKDFRLGVIGLSTRISDPKYRTQIQYIEPKIAIEKALPLFPSDLDLIIALGSVDDEEAQQLAQQELGISAILTTRGAAFEEPRNESRTTALIIETPERGRYIQTMYLRLNTLSDTKLHISALEQPWRDRIVHQKNPSAEKQIAKEGEGRNLVYIELNPLNESYDPRSKTKTEELLTQFKEEQLTKAAKQATQPITEIEVGYASSGSCSTCHSKEFAKWVFTGHANAWQSLILREEDKNPECLACHTTGFGEVGGLGELTDSNLRRFKSVQCESCHGPLQGHPDAPHVQAKPISPKTCLSCHDEANSPNFTFGTYLSKASCQMD
jgi:hypothetical protein